MIYMMRPEGFEPPIPKFVVNRETNVVTSCRY